MVALCLFATNARRKKNQHKIYANCLTEALNVANIRAMDDIKWVPPDHIGLEQFNAGSVSFPSSFSFFFCSASDLCISQVIIPRELFGERNIICTNESW